MFDAKVDPHQYADVEDISGMIGQYIHGNEPSHHLAYLYAYANAPLRTQARLRQIVDTQYRPTPDGLVGNDDLGQMSAWLLFTALRLLPRRPRLQPVRPRPPLRHRRHPPPAQRQNLPHPRRPPRRRKPVPRNVTLNGAPLPRLYLTHEEIMAGGELRFTFSPEATATWSHQPHTPPFSITAQ